MNSLIKTVNAVTMTSREMADLTEKRHDSVKRTIDTLAEKGTVQLPQIVEVTNHLGFAGMTALKARYGLGAVAIRKAAQATKVEILYFRGCAYYNLKDADKAMKVAQ